MNAATCYLAGSGANTNIALSLGRIVVAGALYLGVGAVVALAGHRWLERLMPPIVTGAIVAIIGLNLASDPSRPDPGKSTPRAAWNPL